MDADMQHDCARAAIYRAAIGNLVGNSTETTEGAKEFQEATAGLRGDLDDLAKLPLGKDARTALATMQTALPEYVNAGEAVIARFRKRETKTSSPPRRKTSRTFSKRSPVRWKSLRQHPSGGQCDSQCQ